jgi:hypothetical protein
VEILYTANTSVKFIKIMVILCQLTIAFAASFADSLLLASCRSYFAIVDTDITACCARAVCPFVTEAYNPTYGILGKPVCVLGFGLTADIRTIDTAVGSTRKELGRAAGRASA